MPYFFAEIWVFEKTSTSSSLYGLALYTRLTWDSMGTQTFSEDVSSLRLLRNFPTIQICQLLFQELRLFCSSWCLLWFSSIFGAATGHWGRLCSQQSPHFESQLVLHYTRSRVIGSSPWGSPPSHSWTIGCMLQSSLSVPRNKHWVECFLPFTTRCGGLGEGPWGVKCINFFLSISLRLFLTLSFPGLLSHLNWFLEFSQRLSGPYIVVKSVSLCGN